ncbi:hypothetical protein EXE48_14480 [Halorubrum sp. ASP1]|uniref:hypothetical protein n=1 Tax=Halorubrum sp. ASP1 TaxID=2518114 RepID=UPI0010F5F3C1|nr:hypothetical protein [Halorubrum sp. ASP1]TKX59712.1 hypothetical protein EXE48_14480 [Halorubrum sp. ASP1]
MSPLIVGIITALVSATFGTVSSLIVYQVKFSQEEERYRERKIERWEDEALQELESARQILIDITARRPHNLSSSEYDDIPPDEVAQQESSPEFDRIDGHINRIEELIGRMPDKHDNLGYYFTEISRQYRGTPASDIDQSQYDRWKNIRSFVTNAKEELEENRQSD